MAAPGDHFGTMPGFVAVSRDGQRVAAGGHGKDIAIFDLTRNALERELPGHYHAATAAAFLPDGRLVSGGEERTVRLWDTDMGTLLATWVSLPPQGASGQDVWVGYRATGEYAGSESLSGRLVGWLRGGRLVEGKERDGVLP